MARTIEHCEAMLRVLAPGFEPLELGGIEPPRCAVAWTADAEPLVRACVENAARLLNAEPIDFPRTRNTYPLFMREVADIHRDLYGDHAELYGEDVAVKVERCLAIGDGEVRSAVRARDEYREAAAAALDGYGVLVTPTIPCVAPRVGVGDAALRESLIDLTYPFNALGWPALALPCGTAEDGLPASVQLVGRPGDDALVLAVGRLLSSLLRGTPAPP